MPELFSIETALVRLVWSQTRQRPMPTEPGPPDVPFGLHVEALRGEEPIVCLHAEERLFEQTDYIVFLQSRTGQPVDLRHRDPVLRRGLQRSDGGRVLHGPVNFGAQVGESRFVIAVDGVPHVAFAVEVFPAKLDYRSDYEALCADLQDVARGLVLEALRPAYRRGRPYPAEHADTLSWLHLLRETLDELARALRYVAQHPQWSTEPTRQPMRAERVRHPDSLLHRALQRHGRSPARLDGALPAVLPDRLPAHSTRYTLDTPEHRWLAFQLDHIQQQLAVAVRAERRLPATARRLRVLDELRTLHHEAGRLQTQAPLEAATHTPPPAPTPRLLGAPGYREAYQACLRLRQGLALEAGPVPFALKDLHVLYEYWCFLTLVRLAAEATGQGLPARQLVHVESHGLSLRLRKGQTIRLHGEGPYRLELAYNPLFSGRTYIAPQQPDILLTVRGAAGAPRRYVLDAKYRLDASPAYLRRYGLPGPPVPALNDLHRYRDAIRSRGAQPERDVVQAIALFPYREDQSGAFAASRHHRALSDVGVGAIPLLPGATEHLAAWLRGVLGKVGKEVASGE